MEDKILEDKIFENKIFENRIFENRIFENKILDIINITKGVQWKSRWRHRRLAGPATRVSAVQRRHTQRHSHLGFWQQSSGYLWWVASAIMRTRVCCHLENSCVLCGCGANSGIGQLGGRSWSAKLYKKFYCCSKKWTLSLQKVAPFSKKNLFLFFQNVE